MSRKSSTVCLSATITLAVFVAVAALLLIHTEEIIIIPLRSLTKQRIDRH